MVCCSLNRVRLPPFRKKRERMGHGNVGTGTAGRRRLGRLRGRVAGIGLPVCRLPHPYGGLRRRGAKNRGISAGRFVKKRMLSHVEYERPVTGGTRTAELAGLYQLQIAKRGSGDPRYSRLGSRRYKALYCQRRMMSVALMPPNPNEFERPMSNVCAMALLGT